MLIFDALLVSGGHDSADEDDDEPENNGSMLNLYNSQHYTAEKRRIE